MVPGLEPEVTDAAWQLADQLFLFEQRADCRVVRASCGARTEQAKALTASQDARRRQPARERDIRLRQGRMDGV